jgi:hypothetical protein
MRRKGRFGAVCDLVVLTEDRAGICRRIDIRAGVRMLGVIVS